MSELVEPKLIHMDASERTRPARLAGIGMRILTWDLPLLRAIGSWAVLRGLGLPRETVVTAGFRSYGGQVRCGTGCSLGDTVFFDYAPVRIGSGVNFSFRNAVITSTHDPENWGKILVAPVEIGDDVWITSNVTILQGVRIGSRSVIGAGSVVTRDIPPGVLAAGNPCRPIRTIVRDQKRRGTT